MADHDDENAPIAESFLEPERFPEVAELVLAEHILHLHLKEAQKGER